MNIKPIKERLIPIKIWLLKWYPIFANIWLLILLIAYHYGFDLFKLSNMLLGGCLIISLMLFVDSIIFYFCLWHRVLIINQAIYLVLQFMNRNGVEFNYYIRTAFGLTIISLLLATFLYRKHGCFKGMENNKGIGSNNQ